MAAHVSNDSTFGLPDHGGEIVETVRSPLGLPSLSDLIEQQSITTPPFQSSSAMGAFPVINAEEFNYLLAQLQGMCSKPDVPEEGEEINFDQTYTGNVPDWVQSIELASNAVFQAPAEPHGIVLSTGTTLTRKSPASDRFCFQNLTIRLADSPDSFGWKVGRVKHTVRKPDKFKKAGRFAGFLRRKHGEKAPAR